MPRSTAPCLALVLLAACAQTDVPTVQVADPSVALRHFGTAFDVDDQQQPIADPGHPLAIYPEGQGQNLVQTISVRKPHLEWGYLEVPIACADGVLLNVKIRDGIDGPILYEGDVAGLPAIQDGTFQLLQIYDPAVGPLQLRKKTPYAIEVAAFPGPDATSSTCSWASGPEGDSYAGGQGFYTGPNGWLPLPNGAPGDQEDLPFIALMRYAH